VRILVVEDDAPAGWFPSRSWPSGCTTKIWSRKATWSKVHVAQLRRKLDPHDELKPIETVRGCGYLFTALRKSWPTG
jgi:hypothetical protein